ncbi:MAG: hypothetical protein RIG77_15675 [Cyclobacteriaceae bacterium]
MRTRTRATILLFSLLCFFWAYSANAQNGQSVPDVEKVYLHTDRNQYAMGESIWYKAYQVYAYTNTLFDNSKLLYVELVSPDSKVVVRNVTKMNLGLGHGDIALVDSVGIESGRYQLRAYTNWSRNFEDNFIFKKEIEIIDIRDEKEQVEDQVLDRALVYDVQFFPEGGSLINGVASQVAFKSTYLNGKPCSIVGKVKNSEGGEIAEIESKHDGMGSFIFTPTLGGQYIAELTDSTGAKLEVKLPDVLEKGYLLSVVNHKGRNIITIKTNEETLISNPGKPVSISCTTRGVAYMEGSQPLDATSYTFVLPTESFPEGISQITLFDHEMRPQSERLIYVEKDHGIELSISSEKEEYSTRENVGLDFTAKTAAGAGIVGSFSLAVTDTNVPGGSTPDDMNICSYFLMQSDIKGKVHNPGYYFDRSNKDRLKDLDLLLMTQGWRDFLWKRLPVLNDNPSFEAEKEIKISGRLRKLLADSPIEGAKINMVLNNKGNSLIVDEVTDADGKFEFDDVMFLGHSTLMLTNQNKRARTTGHMILDSLYLPPYKVDYQFDKGLHTTGVFEAFKGKMLKKHIEYQVPLGIDDKLLDEVVVRGSKFVQNEVNDANTSIYGTPDFSYQVPEDGPRFTSIFQLLQFTVPGLTASGNSVSFSRGSPLILLDGSQIDMAVLESVFPTDVAKIESLKNSAGGAVFGAQAANGVVAIYTREGGAGKSKKVYHSINQEIQGYYDARVFYAPSYDEVPSTEDKPDIRNTLYWHPYIQFDANGLAKVSFFNTDASTTVSVVLEGITDTGIPLVVRSNYIVKK